MSLKKLASKSISLLALIELEGDSIERIISVVQENQEYFCVKLGGSALEAAANKLEQLTREAAQHGVQSDECPHCQHGLIVLENKSIIDCIACGSTGIRR